MKLNYFGFHIETEDDFINRCADLEFVGDNQTNNINMTFIDFGDSPSACSKAIASLTELFNEEIECYWSVSINPTRTETYHFSVFSFETGELLLSWDCDSCDVKHKDAF